MATKVIDSWVLMALFNEEPAADAAEKLLEQATAERHKLLMSVVNWGEVYYSVLRGASPEMAEQKLKEMDAMPIEIIGADLHLTKQAAIYKATRKMSYADCFARRWPSCGTPNLSPAIWNSNPSRRKSKSTGL